MGGRRFVEGLYQALFLFRRARRNVITKRNENGPFYRYGGHIELIRFKEYYRMPRGHEHISFVFSSAFLGIFLKVFLE